MPNGHTQPVSPLKRVLMRTIVELTLDIIRLTSRAAELFLHQTGAEQRQLLQVVIKNAIWQEGELRTSLFEPFEILRHSNRESHRKERKINGSGQNFGIWLPTGDSENDAGG